ncbi:Beta-lactamase/transpeptidase-like protein [Metarhizium guizhouense ARSEF 977]|uniref:Beta-lactamase/transpeptidase-like protein n=1 Tax=Metarhizium guizhouense (strain ARSEF 977) TaxID=1276136 RepID=A0A0B4GV67_METGA|nr:Beta-lactamase/transpeptidase-like protein [Metarhizium guizhouense ARSEF 977]
MPVALNRAVFQPQPQGDSNTPYDLQAPAAGYDVTLYGLGWSRTVFQGHVVYSHIGATGAFGTFVFWLPDLRYATAIFGNTVATLNSVETLLSWRLIEDRLEVPKYRRIDVSGQLRKERHDLRDKIVSAFDVLYPERRSPRIPPTQNTTHLAGTNLDPGYGTIQLKETTDPEDAASTVLVGNRSGIIIGFDMLLRHVSGGS